MTTTTNTNYDWANVSDQYLDEIVELQLRVAKRFSARNQWDKFERAMGNVTAAQQERENRKVKAELSFQRNAWTLAIEEYEEAQAVEYVSRRDTLTQLGWL
jgi:hypothetical protein